ncbi:MAG: tRNA dihydrouridine synthase DusB [Bradymonadaceae bacterium]|nr:tRNA dihydrouridine synthase DusB [Lujinxingiaceae bacterium]
MGIAFEKLTPPRFGGEIPEPVSRGPCVLGPGCVIDPPIVLSPMAAVTNPPFRAICRELGAGMVVTEMVNAVQLANGCQRTLELVDLRPGERPVGVQLFGCDPGALAAAAQVAQELGAASVDLNMGCPMRKIVTSGQGAALLRQPKLVYEIFRAMSDAVDIPVTGKTRAGWEQTDAIDIAHAMADAGAAAITIHGRTRSAMYDGHVDLAIIRELKRAVDIKVIGNGDVCDYVSARRMFAVTGCDAIMVARGCLGNPWVFRELAADLRGEPVPQSPTPTEKAQLLANHLALYVETFGEARTCLEIRKHLLWYFRGTPAEKILRARMRDMTSTTHVEEAIAAAMAAEPLPTP